MNTQTHTGGSPRGDRGSCKPRSPKDFREPPEARRRCGRTDLEDQRELRPVDASVSYVCSPQSQQSRNFCGSEPPSWWPSSQALQNIIFLPAAKYLACYKPVRVQGSLRPLK